MYTTPIQGDGITFNAKVSHKFIDVMRKSINSGENRLKNNYRLNAKIDEIDSFGYDQYTIHLCKKNKGVQNQFSLVALKDNETDFSKGIFLEKRNSFGQIKEFFLNLNKNQFFARMKRNISYINN